LESGAIGRRVGPTQSLDTSLDLLTSGERHPGELAVIEARVVVRSAAGGNDVVLARGRQTFRLRVLGFYLEPRGALLFVDPQDDALAAQSFESAVSLSYVAHVGIKGFGFWNDVLNPGLGVTLSLLDFEDGRDLELGIGGSVTILRDFFFVGYGRDLQAEVNVFYIGVNPLALGDLLSLRGGRGYGGAMAQERR
jgi:hypothetical protein